MPIVVRINSFDEESAHEFQEQIHAALETGQPVIPVAIDSYGGEAYSMMGMIDTLESAKQLAVVATIAVGKAMSCGAVFLSAGTPGHRYVAPNATVMLHEAFAAESGKVEDMANSMRELNRLNERMFKMLGKNSGKGSPYFKKQVALKKRADWYMTPQECVKHGIADKVKLPLLVASLDVQYSFG